jgi:hypothetical protein
MVDLLDNLMNILKLFLALEKDFRTSLGKRMNGVRKERLTANRLRRSWWQVERAGPEAKPSENGRFFKLYFLHATSP